ncbi:MAG TPA: poly-beta-hydroxybutyrate polymerase N-terminal domain-containing protein [Ottowia sp.]|uniref:PHA/PHB synthase family protein n=1 Tax=Ottowia sp. TaxID=1898956 RepID=UPI002C50EC42|nr:alpha/beta fold hydrolase [Ottowia sp.]HMN20715.1 poly-beta-hydroxybutyrate polymerase N-terminal domain-containing protein [Ottowia sp.]
MDRHNPDIAQAALRGQREPGRALKVADPYRMDETPTRKLDRLVQTGVSPAFGNLSPIALSLAWADWAWHLAAAPGRQLELAALAARLALDTAQLRDGNDGDLGARDEDPRFRADEWAHWPFSQWRVGFRNVEAFWREAAKVPGVSKHHGEMVDFFARQWLDMLSPANRLATNPVLLRHTLESGGTNLVRGAMNWLADATGVPTQEDIANQGRFVVGGNLAVTPGKVVYRNHLVELIRYAPQTESVHPEPIFIVPSWIMKYYILDLSPHNSMVRYLVSQGHTVYMVSWRNPDESDRNLSMDDYLELGVFEAMRAAAHDAGKAPLHAMGYCLGGTLLAIAVSALARDDGMAGYADLPAPRTLTLLAAQVDFYKPGELGLFIDEGQISLLDNVTRGQGFLTGKQMSGSFQFLHSRDLVWTRRMREYLVGEREQGNDLMAWNADTTRLPARMHHEYLIALYMKNALANGRYVAGGRRVSLSDLKMPIFLVGTERDHVSPWRSVYKLHQLTSAEITFLLTSGGHNAGIVSPPGHPRRRYRIATQPAQAQWLSIDEWLERAEGFEGSWWPAWQGWLARHSSERVKAKPIPASRALCDAPGEYVMQRYAE